jgi:hypothetical protein
MRSEVATLEFLGETKIPAPKVFDFRRCSRVASDQDRDLPGNFSMKMYRTPTGFASSLHAHPFPIMGSLDKIDSKLFIGPFARESLADFGVALG